MCTWRRERIIVGSYDYDYDEDEVDGSAISSTSSINLRHYINFTKDVTFTDNGCTIIIPR